MRTDGAERPRSSRFAMSEDTSPPHRDLYYHTPDVNVAAANFKPTSDGFHFGLL